jgi:VanZ family protein
MLLPLRYPRLWLLAAWSLVAVAIFASVMPVQKLPEVATSDKVQHMAAYAMLAVWFAGIYPKSRYAWIAVGLFILGVAIEGAQGVMGFGRQADFYDMAANASGIAAGLFAAWLGLGGRAMRVEKALAGRR